MDGCTLGYIDEVVYNERAAASKETGKSSAPGFAAAGRLDIDDAF